MDVKINKKGQIAIFVIVAMLLVAAFALVFAIFRSPSVSLGEEFEPKSFVDKCIKDSVKDIVNIMVSQGGLVSPTDYKVYNDIKVTYLCKNINYYEPCITQYPRYITQLQEEIEINVESEMEQCFILLEDELEKRNYEYSGGEISLQAVLKPDTIEFIVFRDFTLSKNEVQRNFDSFRVVIKSSLYDIANIANEIASQEAKFCYFEYVGFNLLYPKFDIRKYTMSDSTKIYTIKYDSTGEEMNIAVRGCAIPPGF